MSRKSCCFGCLAIFLFIMLTPVGFLIYWNLRSDVIFISFLNDSENLVFVRENGKVVLQNNQGVRLGQKKFRNLRSIIGSQPDKGLFAFSTNKQELHILKISDKIVDLVFPIEYSPNKVAFSGSQDVFAVSSQMQQHELDVFGLSQKKHLLKIKIRSQSPIQDFIFMGNEIWVQCNKKGENIYVIDTSEYGQGDEVTVSDGKLSDYQNIIGLKILRDENRFALYSKNSIYIIDSHNSKNKKLDCLDNEIVSIIGSTDSELYVLCKYIDNDSFKSEKNCVLVWDMELCELKSQNVIIEDNDLEIGLSFIRYYDPIFLSHYKMFIFTDGSRMVIYDIFSSKYQELPSSIDKFYHKRPPLCFDKKEDQLAYYATIMTRDSSDSVRVIDLRFLDNQNEGAFPTQDF